MVVEQQRQVISRISGVPAFVSGRLKHMDEKEVWGGGTPRPSTPPQVPTLGNETDPKPRPASEARTDKPPRLPQEVTSPTTARPGNGGSPQPPRTDRSHGRAWPFQSWTDVEPGRPRRPQLFIQRVLAKYLLAVPANAPWGILQVHKAGNRVCGAQRCTRDGWFCLLGLALPWLYTELV